MLRRGMGISIMETIREEKERDWGNGGEGSSGVGGMQQ